MHAGRRHRRTQGPVASTHELAGDRGLLVARAPRKGAYGPHLEHLVAA
jgi:hypothetical protein